MTSFLLPGLSLFSKDYKFTYNLELQVDKAIKGPEKTIVPFKYILRLLLWKDIRIINIFSMGFLPL